MTRALRQWVDQVLGDHSIGGLPPATARREGTSQRVVEVVDSGGMRWFAKQVADPRSWHAEVHAYRQWVPALGTRAPTLRAAAPGLRTLLMSAVPGQAPLRTDARAHREAGVLLRRLHESRPARTQQPSDRGRTVVLLDGLLARRSGLFTPVEVAFVGSQANRINDLPLDKKVPCHGDYKWHNWLVDSVNTLRVIDFGESRWAIAAFDFSKLFFGVWWRRPDLAAAFFEGYGRQLTEHELEFVRLRMATYAVQEVAFGHDRGTPQHEDHGRSRLADLMAGYQVKAGS